MVATVLKRLFGWTKLSSKSDILWWNNSSIRRRGNNEKWNGDQLLRGLIGELMMYSLVRTKTGYDWTVQLIWSRSRDFNMTPYIINYWSRCPQESSRDSHIHLASILSCSGDTVEHCGAPCPWLSPSRWTFLPLNNTLMTQLQPRSHYERWMRAFNGNY